MTNIHIYMSQRLTVGFLWDMNSATLWFGLIFLFKHISYSVFNRFFRLIFNIQILYFFFQYVGMERRLFSALFLYTRQQKEGNLLIPHMHRQMHSCFYCCCTEFVGFFFLSSLEINGWCLVFCALTVWTAEAGLDKWERLHKAKTFLSVVMWLFFFLFNVLWRCSMGFLCELLPVDPVLQRWI